MHTQNLFLDWTIIDFPVKNEVQPQVENNLPEGTEIEHLPGVPFN